VIPWRDVFGLLAEKGYTGIMSLEAPNPATWARPPVDVTREAATTLRRLIAEATAA
jgi:sugar phosphate isomerase/epimerase